MSLREVSSAVPQELVLQHSNIFCKDLERC